MHSGYKLVTVQPTVLPESEVGLREELKFIADRVPAFWEL